PAWSQSLWLALLLGEAALAAIALGMANMALIWRLASFAAALVVVLSGFLAANSWLADETADLALRWSTELPSLAIGIAVPYFCVGGAMGLLRLLTGPVTHAADGDLASSRRLETLGAVALVGLAAAAVVLAALANERLGEHSVALGKQLLSTPNTVAQLAGAAAFALASGGVWRVVGFTYLACVSLQGYHQAEARDAATLLSAVGPWILVLANLLALRAGGYLFANSHESAADEETPAAPFVPIGSPSD
ncbi:MAG: hypothetical protein AAF961_13755, partial [Planctomycetota bacterium]